MELASHAWITRFLFPKRSDSRHDQYILHFENPNDKEELLESFYTLLRDFNEEIGGQWATPAQIATGRFLIEGPKGFAIIEVAPAYTEEEYNKIIDSEGSKLDLSVWEQMFQTTLPQEPTPETDRSGE